MAERKKGLGRNLGNIIDENKTLIPYPPPATPNGRAHKMGETVVTSDTTSLSAGVRSIEFVLTCECGWVSDTLSARYSKYDSPTVIETDRKKRWVEHLRK